jgi:hypothetical protein
MFEIATKYLQEKYPSTFIHYTHEFECLLCKATTIEEFREIKASATAMDKLSLRKNIRDLSSVNKDDVELYILLCKYSMNTQAKKDLLLKLTQLNLVFPN